MTVLSRDRATRAGEPAQRPPAHSANPREGPSSLPIIGRRLPASSPFVLARA